MYGRIYDYMTKCSLEIKFSLSWIACLMNIVKIYSKRISHPTVSAIVSGTWFMPSLKRFPLGSRNYSIMTPRLL